MATTAIDLRKLQDQIKQLQKRVARLEAELKPTSTTRINASRAPKSNKEIVALLKTRGLVGEPTPEERQMAAEWRALAPRDQELLTQTLRRIRLDRPISELIAELRS